MRSRGKDTKIAETSIAEYKDRLGTSRIHVHVPLFIYGSLSGGNPFCEEAYTISINGNGGLIWMASSVQPGQRIRVTNQGNDQTQECVVVSVAAQLAGSFVAFKFPTPMPQFWHGLEIGKGTLRNWIEYFIEALILLIGGDRTAKSPLQDRTMSNSWKEWEGQTIDSKFPLIDFVGESEHSAVFLTERQAGGVTVPAAIKIVPAGTDHGERQLDKWRQAAELSHLHMIRLYEIGRCEVGGIEAIYLVMERAEENLAQIVPGRALATDEARAVLDSVVDVLAYLHAKGFVHGHIKPSNIMASGDELKVSSDSLSRAGDAIDRRGDTNAYEPPEYKPSVAAVPQTMGPSGDIWSLGMTLVEVLTKALPVARTDQQKNPQSPQTLPNPFLDIANHCLVRHPQGRWTAVQIADYLQGRVTLPDPQSARPKSREASAPARSPRPMAVVEPQVRHAAAGPVRQSAKRRSFAVPVALGLAVLLASVVLGVEFSRDNSQPASTPAAPNEQAAVPAASAPAAAPGAKLETAPSLKHQQVGSEPVLSDDGPKSKAPVQIPASIHPAAAPKPESSSVANLFTANPLRGEVAHQVMPEVLPAVRNSIRGTVQVIVNVNVDHEGNVEDAELAARGPSKYFDREALQAARLWKFNPPRIGGQGVLSSWRLQFEFTRDSAKVIPMQVMP